MLGPYLLLLLFLYLITVLIRDIIEDFIEPETEKPFILRLLYFIPKLIPLILVGGFFIFMFFKDIL